MPENLPLRQMPRSKLYEVFKTQEGVDLYETLLRQAGDVLPTNVQQAIEDAAAAAVAASEALADAQTRQLRANLVGQVAWFACNTPPTDWLECNGSAVNEADYPELFARIGTTFGGGVGTFFLPDLRGEFVRGWDHGRGVDPGRTFGSNQADELKSHTHTTTTAASENQAVIAVGGAFFDTNNATVTGATGGTETRPRNVALLPCIHT